MPTTVPEDWLRAGETRRKPTRRRMRSETDPWRRSMDDAG
jgi:hypothetical protein